MTLYFESLLSKVVGWCKQSTERNDCVHWPDNVLPYLEKEFRLLPKDMLSLRSVSCPGLFGGMPVNLVRLCDRAKAYEQGIIVKGYYDLDKHPELVLFEGYILKSGTVHLRKKELTVAG